MEDASLPAAEDSPQALLVPESTDSPQKLTEGNPSQLPSPPLLPAPPHKAISKITKSVTGQSLPVSTDFPNLLYTVHLYGTIFFLHLFARFLFASYCESGWLQ